MNPHQDSTSPLDQPQTPGHDDLLTVPEVAQRLRISQETVRSWLRTGGLRGANLGGRAGWRVRASDIESLLHARTAVRDTQPPDGNSHGG